MRLNLIVLAACLLGGYALALLFDNTTPPPPPAAKTAPAFSFQDLNGEKHALEDFRGKTIILNFWATWCPPCIREFPVLVEIAHKYPDDVVLIALSSDTDDKIIAGFLKNRRIPVGDNIHIARDRENISGTLFQTYRLPETFVIGDDLEIRRKFIGANWKPQDLEALVDKVQRTK
jgi:cytochrome c biogenesis protein CcmG, thiol:disulfide interchange protein DsbE